MTEQICPLAAACFEIHLSNSIDDGKINDRGGEKKRSRNVKKSDEEIFFEPPRAGGRHYQVGTEE